jgi:hypothetical protein
MINSMPDPACPTRRSAARLAIFLLALGSCLLLAVPAARADCPVDVSCVTEPVAGVVQDPVGTVEGVVEDPVGTVEETVDETVQTVEETVGTVEDTVDEVTGTVEDTVDPVLGGGGDDPVDPVVDETAVLAVETENAAGQTQQGGEPGSQTGGGSEGGAFGGPRPRDAVGSTTLAGSSTPAPASGAQGAIRTVPSDAPLGFGDLFRNVVAGLVFPSILALIVVAFVAVQNRLDRRDPKLALAPIGPDVLTFA